MNDRLQKMRELGQAPWVDEISREDIQNGGLQKMIEDGMVGVTSNPAIFQKAIAGSDLYDDQLHEEAVMDHADTKSTLEEGVEEAKQLFERLREAGLDYEDVTDILEKEGLQKFADPFNEMLEEISNESRELVS